MQLLDKYYNSIKIGDTVSLFGEIGQVNEEMGALGIYFKAVSYTHLTLPTNSLV